MTTPMTLMFITRGHDESGLPSKTAQIADPREVDEDVDHTVHAPFDEGFHRGLVRDPTICVKHLVPSRSYVQASKLVMSFGVMPLLLQ